MSMLNADSRRPLLPYEEESFSGDTVWSPIDGPRSIFRLLGTKRDLKTGKIA